MSSPKVECLRRPLSQLLNPRADPIFEPAQRASAVSPSFGNTSVIYSNISWPHVGSRAESKRQWPLHAVDECREKNVHSFPNINRKDSLSQCYRKSVDQGRNSLYFDTNSFFVLTTRRGEELPIRIETCNVPRLCFPLCQLLVVHGAPFVCTWWINSCMADLVFLDPPHNVILVQDDHNTSCFPLSAGGVSVFLRFRG